MPQRTEANLYNQNPLNVATGTQAQRYALNNSFGGPKNGYQNTYAPNQPVKGQMIGNKGQNLAGGGMFANNKNGLSKGYHRKNFVIKVTYMPSNIFTICLNLVFIYPACYFLSNR